MGELGKKLQLKPAQSLLLLNAPEQVALKLITEGYDATVSESITEGSVYDVVQLFVHQKAELEHFAPLATAALRAEGMLWIAYPKKTSKVTSDLTRDEGWAAIKELGYEGVRQIAVDDTWSALRFVHKANRKKPSKMGVDLPGVDRDARTVTPPKDLQEALGKAGLIDLFNELSFTHKKEHVAAVLEAKRPETRARRIEKTINMLQDTQKF
ncbi:YdeI/OmpD-associated family protein [Pontibacter harenae]|uniref:YdeI/OmpD-associated family protein n=1 Tax=Pontibacter harenae TaxID=2894083 RepID=UPI001E54F9B3|nr:YdeI/OmpD-associated family protein [Pontibacter harenae]MCC9168470.1 YdeI/OmpD-associated family protein [Pontibacter harenae]